MTSIASNYKAVLDKVNECALKSGRNPGDVTLVAVSKTFPLEKIKEAYNAGARVFGENYIQEAVEKTDKFNEGIAWHFIGHLQTNKVKVAVGRFDLIETVDSFKLSIEIDKRALSRGMVQDILLEVNLAGEESKYGFTGEALLKNISEISQLKNIRVKGLMTIPPFNDNPEDSRQYFIALRELMDEINSEKIYGLEMSEISMGMSSDYEIAIEEGATIVRVGTSIFGNRSYKRV